MHIYIQYFVFFFWKKHQNLMGLRLFIVRSVANDQMVLNHWIIFFYYRDCHWPYLLLFRRCLPWTTWRFQNFENTWYHVSVDCSVWYFSLSKEPSINTSRAQKKCITYFKTWSTLSFEAAAYFITNDWL